MNDLNIDKPAAIGHLHAIWYTAIEQQEDGDLSDWSNQMIAAAAEWKGDPDVFVSSLQLRGFLDGKLLHDWIDYAGRYLTAKYHTANPKKLKAIYAKHKATCSPPKVRLKSANRIAFRTELQVGKGRYPNGSNTERGEGEGEEKTKPFSPATLIELYNSSTPAECPAVTVISPARLEKAYKYLAMFPSPEFWQEAFRQIHQSKFLRGLKNNNGHESFVADFDWLLSKGKDGSENAVKVHDGRYRDGK